MQLEDRHGALGLHENKGGWQTWSVQTADGLRPCAMRRASLPDLLDLRGAPTGDSGTKPSVAGVHSWNAVNGNHGDLPSSLCQQYTNQQDPWWHVDFGALFMVKMVRLFSRTDCCADLLQNVNLYLGNNQRSYLGNVQVASGVSVPSNYPLDVRVHGNVQGSILWVARPGEVGLAICQIQVWGTASCSLGQPVLVTGCEADPLNTTTLRTGVCLASEWSVALPRTDAKITFTLVTSAKIARDTSDAIEFYLGTTLIAQRYNTGCNQKACFVEITVTADDREVRIVSKSNNPVPTLHIEVTSMTAACSDIATPPLAALITRGGGGGGGGTCIEGATYYYKRPAYYTDYYNQRFPRGSSACVGALFCQFKEMAQAEEFCNSKFSCTGIVIDANNGDEKFCADNLGCYFPSQGALVKMDTWPDLGITMVKTRCDAKPPPPPQIEPRCRPQYTIMGVVCPQDGKNLAGDYVYTSGYVAVDRTSYSKFVYESKQDPSCKLHYNGADQMWKLTCGAIDCIKIPSAVFAIDGGLEGCVPPSCPTDQGGVDSNGEYAEAGFLNGKLKYTNSKRCIVSYGIIQGMIADSHNPAGWLITCADVLRYFVASEEARPPENGWTSRTGHAGGLPKLVYIPKKSPAEEANCIVPKFQTDVPTLKIEPSCSYNDITPPENATVVSAPGCGKGKYALDGVTCQWDQLGSECTKSTCRDTVWSNAFPTCRVKRCYFQINGYSRTGQGDYFGTLPDAKIVCSGTPNCTGVLDYTELQSCTNNSCFQLATGEGVQWDPQGVLWERIGCGTEWHAKQGKAICMPSEQIESGTGYSRLALVHDKCFALNCAAFMWQRESGEVVFCKADRFDEDLMSKQYPKWISGRMSPDRELSLAAMSSQVELVQLDEQSLQGAAEDALKHTLGDAADSVLAPGQLTHPEFAARLSPKSSVLQASDLSGIARTAQNNAAQWTVCAPEGGECKCIGLVLYGRAFKEGKPGSGTPTSAVELMQHDFKQQKVLRSIQCDSQDMAGDPALGFTKHCICMPYTVDEQLLAVVDTKMPVGEKSAETDGSKSTVQCENGYTMTSCSCTSTASDVYRCKGAKINGNECEAVNWGTPGYPIMKGDQVVEGISSMVQAYAVCTKFSDPVQTVARQGQLEVTANGKSIASCPNGFAMTGCGCFSDNGFCDGATIVDSPPQPKQCVAYTKGAANTTHYVVAQAQCVRATSAFVPNILTTSVHSLQAPDGDRSIVSVGCPEPTVMVGCECLGSQRMACHKSRIENIGGETEADAKRVCSAVGPRVQAIAHCAAPIWQNLHCNWHCYLDRYPDLRANFGRTDTSKAAWHYEHHGRHEGRDCRCPRMATCAPGYTAVNSDVPGLGMVEGRGGGETVWHCGQCSKLCDAKARCKSYECDPLQKRCNLNDSGARMYSGQEGNYNFCVKGSRNVAISRVATVYSSSVAFGGKPDRAVDGRLNRGHFTSDVGGVCAATKKDEPSWITLDMKFNFAVGSINVIGRHDCCPEQSVGWTIRVGDTGGPTDRVCQSDIDAAGGDVVEVKCPKVMTGRFVSVWSDQAITLCEIEVFPVLISENVALNQLTDSSTVKKGGESRKAVDGESNQGALSLDSSGVCAATNPRNGTWSWVSVDLGGLITLWSVDVIGRSDCCREQSRLWTIRVGNHGTEYDPVCKRDVSADGGLLVTVPCDEPMAGRYVSVWSAVAMTLCELSVYPVGGIANGMEADFYKQNPGPNCTFPTDLEEEPVKMVTPNLDFNATGWVVGGEEVPSEYDNTFVAIFSGLLHVALPGKYTFVLEADDSAWFSIDGDEAVANKGCTLTEDPQRRSKRADGSEHLLPGLHPIQVKYTDSYDKKGLRLKWSGPGFNDTIVASKLLYHRPDSADIVPVQYAARIVETYTATGQKFCCGKLGQEIFLDLAGDGKNGLYAHKGDCKQICIRNPHCKFFEVNPTAPMAWCMGFTSCPNLCSASWHEPHTIYEMTIKQGPTRALTARGLSYRRTQFTLDTLTKGQKAWANADYSFDAVPQSFQGIRMFVGPKTLWLGETVEFSSPAPGTFFAFCTRHQDAGLFNTLLASGWDRYHYVDHNKEAIPVNITVLVNGISLVMDIAYIKDSGKRNLTLPTLVSENENETPMVAFAWSPKDFSGYSQTETCNTEKGLLRKLRTNLTTMPKKWAPMVCSQHCTDYQYFVLDTDNECSCYEQEPCENRAAGDDRAFTQTISMGGFKNVGSCTPAYGDAMKLASAPHTPAECKRHCDEDYAFFVVREDGSCLCYEKHPCRNSAGYDYAFAQGDPNDPFRTFFNIATCKVDGTISKDVVAFARGAVKCSAHCVEHRWFVLQKNERCACYDQHPCDRGPGHDTAYQIAPTGPANSMATKSSWGPSVDVCEGVQAWGDSEHQLLDVPSFLLGASLFQGPFAKEMYNRGGKDKDSNIGTTISVNITEPGQIWVLYEAGERDGGFQESLSCDPWTVDPIEVPYGAPGQQSGRLKMSTRLLSPGLLMLPQTTRTFVGTLIVKTGAAISVSTWYEHSEHFGNANISEPGYVNDTLRCFVTGEPNETSIARLPGSIKVPQGATLIYSYQYMAGAGCENDMHGAEYNLTISGQLIDKGGPLYRFPYDTCSGNGCSHCFSDIVTQRVSMEEAVSGHVEFGFTNNKKRLYFIVVEIAIEDPDGIKELLVGGDSFIQMGEWRMGSVVDGKYFAITHKNGMTASLFEQQNTTVVSLPGPHHNTAYNLWDKPAKSPPPHVMLGTGVLQIGEWRMGNADSTHMTISTEKGSPGVVWGEDAQEISGAAVHNLTNGTNRTSSNSTCRKKSAKPAGGGDSTEAETDEDAASNQGGGDELTTWTKPLIPAMLSFGAGSNMVQFGTSFRVGDADGQHMALGSLLTNTTGNVYYSSGFVDSFPSKFSEFAIFSRPLVSKIGLKGLADTFAKDREQCANGITLKGSDVCCMASCGECGGLGCEGRNGGARGCCTSHIRKDNRNCVQFSAPCIIMKRGWAPQVPYMQLDKTCQNSTDVSDPIPTDSVERCEQLCDDNEECMGFDTNKKTCVLKSTCHGKIGSCHGWCGYTMTQPRLAEKLKHLNLMNKMITDEKWTKKKMKMETCQKAVLFKKKEYHRLGVNEATVKVDRELVPEGIAKHNIKLTQDAQISSLRQILESQQSKIAEENRQKRLAAAKLMSSREAQDRHFEEKKEELIREEDDAEHQERSLQLVFQAQKRREEEATVRANANKAQELEQKQITCETLAVQNHKEFRNSQYVLRRNISDLKVELSSTQKSLKLALNVNDDELSKNLLIAKANVTDAESHEQFQLLNRSNLLAKRISSQILSLKQLHDSYILNRTQIGCEWKYCGGLQCKVCPSGYDLTKVGETNMTTGECDCHCVCKPTAVHPVPGLAWMDRDAFELGSGACFKSGLSQIGICNRGVKVKGCLDKKTVELWCDCDSMYMWGFSWQQHDEFAQCGTPETLPPFLTSAMAFTTWMRGCKLGHELQPLPCSLQANGNQELNSSLLIQLQESGEPETASKDAYRLHQGVFEKYDASAQLIGFPALNVPVKQRNAAHDCLVPEGTCRKSMHKVAQETRIMYEKEMARYGFNFVPGYRTWLEYGLSPEDVECGAVFSYGMAVCKAGKQVTVKCDTAQDGDLKEIQVGCGCQRLHVMVKVAGFMDSQLTLACSGKMQTWSQNLEQTYMRTGAAELCAANIIRECGKIELEQVKLARLKTIKLLTAQTGEIVDIDSVVRQISEENAKEQNIIGALHLALKVPMFGYAKLPGFGLALSAKDAESNAVCRNICDRHAACKSYSFNKRLGKCATSANALDYDDDFVLYIKSQDPQNQEHFAEIAGLKIGGDAQSISHSSSEASCKYDCLMSKRCTCASYSETRQYCIHSELNVAFGSDWDYYEKGSHVHEATEDLSNAFAPGAMQHNHNLQLESIKQSIQSWEFRRANANEKVREAEAQP